MEPIAWMTDSFRPYMFHILELEKRGFSVQRYDTASDLLKDSLRTKFSVIVLDPYIAPGAEHHDAVLEQLAREYECNLELDYFRVGMRTLELLRSEDSLNRRTPIVCVGLHLFS